MKPRQGLGVVSPAFEAEALASLDSLYRAALRLTRVTADAEDLVQETYLKAFRAAERFEPGTNMRAWLFTILHNSARNRARDRAREAVTVDSEIVERALEMPDGGGLADTPESLLMRDTLAPELQAYADKNKVFLHGFGANIGNGHWNQLGHRVAGEMIAQKLCDVTQTVSLRTR